MAYTVDMVCTVDMGLTGVRWLKGLTGLVWLLYIQCDMVRTPMGTGFIGYVVKEAEGADLVDGAARAIGTEETDVAEMVLRMNALFY